MHKKLLMHCQLLDYAWQYYHAIWRLFFKVLHRMWYILVSVEAQLAVLVPLLYPLNFTRLVLSSASSLILFLFRHSSPLWQLAPMRSTAWPLTSRCSSRSGLRTWPQSRAGTCLGSSSSYRRLSTKPLAKHRPGPTLCLPRERGRRSDSAGRGWKKRRKLREKDRGRVQGRERFGHWWLRWIGF